MAGVLMSITFLWMLSLTSSSTVTFGTTDNFTQVFGGVTILSKASGQSVTQTAVSRKQGEKTEGPQTSLPMTRTSFRSFSPDSRVKTALTTPVIPKTSMRSIATSATTFAISKVSVSTTPMLSGATQTRDAGKPFLLTTEQTSTVASQSTSLIATPSVTHATESTKEYKSSTTATKSPFVRITKAKKRKDPKKKRPDNEFYHSTVVASLIGAALLLMLLGLLVVYLKRRKLKERQFTTNDWAGPSPFLEDGAVNDQATLRSSHRISLHSFLPQRLSKRMSLLPEEAGEELSNITVNTTFGGKCQTSTAKGEPQSGDMQGSNGAHTPEVTTTADVPEIIKNAESEDSRDPTSTNGNQK